VKNLTEEQMQQRADAMWDEREFELDFATACNMMLGKPSKRYLRKPLNTEAKEISGW
jgi:hypothetical protein